MNNHPRPITTASSEVELDTTHHDHTVDKSKRRLLTVMGTVLGTSAASTLFENNAFAVATAYTPKPSGSIQAGKIFNKDLMADLQAVCQTIIPATETLGAGDVDVHGFIDNQLYHCYQKHQIDQITEVLTALSERHNDGFRAMSDNKKVSLLSKLDGQHGEFSKSLLEGFKLLKRLVVFGYYTTEEGASKELTYLPFPGPFRGSVPYKSVGKGFGSLAYY